MFLAGAGRSVYESDNNLKTRKQIPAAFITPALMAQLVLPAADAPMPRPDGKPADMTKKVKVFILLGQSNMVGADKVKGGDVSLEFAVREKKKYPYLVQEDGKWTERQDARFVRYMSGKGPLKGCEVAGFFFWQGERDAGNAGRAAHYEQNLVIGKSRCSCFGERKAQENSFCRHPPAMKFFAILLTCFAVVTISARGADRPNIIFILSDDHAQQTISAYGSKVIRDDRPEGGRGNRNEVFEKNIELMLRWAKEKPMQP